MTDGLARLHQAGTLIPMATAATKEATMATPTMQYGYCRTCGITGSNPEGTTTWAWQHTLDNGHATELLPPLDLPKLRTYCANVGTELATEIGATTSVWLGTLDGRVYVIADEVEAFELIDTSGIVGNRGRPTLIDAMALPSTWDMGMFGNLDLLWQG